MEKLEPIWGESLAELVKNISVLLDTRRKKVVNSVNNILIQTYWQIGKQIVEFEQNGKDRAKYGSNLLKRLSQDLMNKFGLFSGLTI